MVSQKLYEVGLTLGEGPLWSPTESALYFVDILSGTVFKGDLEGHVEKVSTFSEPVSALLETDQHTILALTSSGLFTLEGKELRRHCVGDGLRTNDGKVAPDGRLLFGTMGMPEPIEGTGSLWVTDSKLTRVLLDGVTISNGLAWDSSGETLFYIDTPTQQIAAFDYDQTNGAISNHRIFAEIDESHGAPDGMTIDSEGGLWVALWGGGAVQRYFEGEITDRVEIPTPYVTCPVFAGDDLDQLVVTTAAEPFAGNRPAGAGDVYVIRDVAEGVTPFTFDTARFISNG